MVEQRRSNSQTVPGQGSIVSFTQSKIHQGSLDCFTMEGERKLMELLQSVDKAESCTMMLKNVLSNIQQDQDNIMKQLSVTEVEASTSFQDLEAMHEHTMLFQEGIQPSPTLKTDICNYGKNMLKQKREIQYIKNVLVNKIDNYMKKQDLVLSHIDKFAKFFGDDGGLIRSETGSETDTSPLLRIKPCL